MLYKGYSIELWRSEWIGKQIDGVWYSLSAYEYHDRREKNKSYKYIALVDKLNPFRAWEIWGASTPLIALDLARFSIDLNLSHHKRWDMEERWKKHNQKLLESRLKKQSANT